MKAIYISNNKVELRDIPRPECLPGESLIHVQLAGICNTDLELKSGYMDFTGVPGHEFVGLVVESDAPALIGRRVCGEINAACCRCEYCRKGLGRHCPDRTTLGIFDRPGAHAEFLRLPTVNLHVIPDALSNEEAVFTEPLAAACEVLEQVHIKPTDRVVVVGDGKLGILVAQVLSLSSCDLHVIGRHQDKLEILDQRGILTEVVDFGEESDLPAMWADIVVECTGNTRGFSTARRLVKPRGRFVLKSTYRKTAEIDLTALVVDEITLVGSRCGPFPPAVRLLERRQVDVTSLIHNRFALSQGPAAYERAAEKGVLKILLDTTS